MTERTEQLLNEILSLPPVEMAELLEQLQSQLGEAELPFDAQWIAELHRRAEEHIASGKRGSTIDEIEARLRSRK
jgi:putative addiction module component (TIGR02574 family)